MDLKVAEIVKDVALDGGVVAKQAMISLTRKTEPAKTKTNKKCHTMKAERVQISSLRDDSPNRMLRTGGSIMERRCEPYIHMVSFYSLGFEKEIPQPTFWIR